MSNSEAKVRVRFVTQCQKYAISDTPFAVPAKLTRSGLSKVINHILKSISGTDDEESGDISFDFLLQGHIIRMSLGKLVSKMNLSTEDVITVEYFPAVSIDNEGMKSNDQSPAWISCIDSHSLENEFVVGCYDGSIRLVSAETSSMTELDATTTDATTTGGKHHDGPITDVFGFMHQSSAGKPNTDVVVSCGKDHKVKCFARSVGASSSSSGAKSKKGNTSADAAGRFKQVASFEGHLSSVTCLDVYQQCHSQTDRSCSKLLLVSGDWSGNVFAWKDWAASIDNSTAAAPVAAASTSSKKKMKLNNESGVDSANVTGLTQIHHSSPAFSIHAHSQAVSDVQLYSDAATTNATNSSPLPCTNMITSSWDHSLKIWDLERQDNIRTFNTGRVITSLHYSAVNRMILVSHPDGKIKLYDNRQQAAASADDAEMSANNCIKTFGIPSSTSTATPQWISQVRWHPTSANLFACTDYDGSVKLWDTRTLNVPLRTVKDVHEGKGLCLDWVLRSETDASLVCGGSDCCVKTLNVNDVDNVAASGAAAAMEA